MIARLFSFCVFALLTATLVFWGYKLFGKPIGVPALAQIAGDGASVRSDWSRLLGSVVAAPVAAVAAPTDGRFRLIGVAAPRMGSTIQEGVALISIDGQPPRPFRLGATVDGDLRLMTVARREAVLAAPGGGQEVNLSLPEQDVNSPGGVALAMPGNSPAPGMSPPMPNGMGNGLPRMINPNPIHGQSPGAQQMPMMPPGGNAAVNSPLNQ